MSAPHGISPVKFTNDAGWTIVVRRMPTDIDGCTHMALGVHMVDDRMLQAWAGSQEDAVAVIERAIGGV